MSEPTASAPASPEAMRTAMADYVRAVHQAYLEAAAQLPPAERARLPLLSADALTVVAVGTRYLHVIGTTERLPAPQGPEVEVPDAIGDLHWRVRYFDPVVLPELGLIDETDSPQPGQVRDALGIRTVVYHLSVAPGGGLTPHHALHAGTGLSHAHATAHRDFDSIASLVPRSAELVAELRGAHVAGLAIAQLLLARAIDPASSALAGMSLDSVDSDDVRRSLLASLREVDG
jgi:hypothetical protein